MALSLPAFLGILGFDTSGLKLRAIHVPGPWDMKAGAKVPQDVAPFHSSERHFTGSGAEGKASTKACGIMFMKAW